MKRCIVCVLVFLMVSIGAASAQDMEFGPSSTPLIPGIDVSAWQGEIDFESVRTAGVEIVYIRAGEGGDYEDPYFRQNAENARSAGLRIGFYYFVTALSEDEAVSQAAHFAELIQGIEPDCLLALDYGVADRLTDDALTAYARAFLTETQTRTGYGVVLYTDASGARDRYGAELAEFPIWVADYGASSPEPNGKWESWVGWQYSDRGRVAGINSNVDLDHFTKEILLSTPTPTPKNSTPQYVMHAPGDTLSTIAARYGVTVIELTEYNHIPTSGARAGQILRILNEQPPAQSGAQSVFIAPSDGRLEDVARHFGLTTEALARVNELPSPTRVFRGQVIKLPAIVSRDTLISAPDTLLDQAYIVQSGDTLNSVASAFGLTADDLAQYNGLTASETVYVGQILKLQSYGAPEDMGFYGAYVVMRGDTLSSIARRFDTTVTALFEANAIRDRNVIITGQVLVIPRDDAN